MGLLKVGAAWISTHKGGKLAGKEYFSIPIKREELELMFEHMKDDKLQTYLYFNSAKKEDKHPDYTLMIAVDDDKVPAN